MNFGQETKNYVSLLSVPNVIDKREILNRVLNVTNEDLSVVEMLELMGRSEVTSQVEYHNLVNEELSTNIMVTAVDTSTYSTSRPLVTVSASDFALVRPGELLLTANGQVGYLKAKASYGSVTLASNQFELVSVNGKALGIVVGGKLAAFSNAAGEGSSAPLNRRYGMVRETNQIQIFKESFKTTDISIGSETEFTYNGQPYYFRYEQAMVYNKFMQAVSMGLFFGRQSTDTFNDSIGASTITDTDGNIVSMTKSLNEYCEGGIQLPVSGISTQTYAQLSRALQKARCPQEYMILMGMEQSIAHDNMLNALTQAEAISPYARFMIDGREVDLGVDRFKIYGRTFTKKMLRNIDHQNLINFTGSAGYQNRAWFLPMDKIKTADGEMLDRFMLRYQKLPIASQANATTDSVGKYREVRLGGLADGVATNSESTLQIVMEARLGLHMLGVQHFVALDLA